MSRIRSIHPGLFTDESFVSVSVPARLFLTGIWTEADDHGVFEWKPLSLKMKLFPVDNIDVKELLSELVDANIIHQFAHEGKQFGIVRNFCKWQRPKKPSYRFQLPDHLRTYTGLKEATTELPATTSEPVPHQSGTPPEKRSQMEEGEKEVEGEKEESKKPSLRSGSRQRGTRIADDWKPSADDIESARAEGLSDTQIAREVSKFLDYWRGRPGKEGIKLDWAATWRNWVRRHAEERGIAPKTPSNSPSCAASSTTFYAQQDSEELAAWDAHNLATKGKGCPRDRNFGWHVPSRWPPGYVPRGSPPSTEAAA